MLSFGVPQRPTKRDSNEPSCVEVGIGGGGGGGWGLFTSENF